MSGVSPGPSHGFHDIAESSLLSRQPELSSEDESESDDPVAKHNQEEVLLSSDPLDGVLDRFAQFLIAYLACYQNISFKPKPKVSKPNPLNFFSRFTNSARQSSPLHTPSHSRGASRTSIFTESGAGSPAPGLNTNGSPPYDESKDGGPLDWYVEGPGRRVGYENMTAIDWIFEYTKERQRLRVLHSSAKGIMGSITELLDASQVWLVLIASGVAVGILAAGIDIVSDWLSDLKTGYCKNGVGGGKFYLSKGFCCWGHQEWSQCRDWTPWNKALHINSKGGSYVTEYIFYILFSVFFAACASFLVKKYAIYARHSGIPEIKTVLGGFVLQRFMGPWTLVIKSLGLCLAVASGLWLGKEGPLVHVACCCANLFMKLSDTLNNNEARKREVISAAAAAGISVAFGSPIGGVLFSLEQLSYYFPDKTMWQSFVCAMIAAVTLQAINPFRTGKIVLFQVTYSSGWHAFEIGPFLFLGLVGGLYGALFIKLNMFVARWRRHRSPLRNSPVTEVVIITAVTAMVNFPNLFMRASSSELVYSLFAECASIPDDRFSLCHPHTTFRTVTLLLLAALLGFFFASLTFGLQLPAGIILPSMTIGALYGRALGLLVSHYQLSHPKYLIFSTCEPDIPCVTPGTYAIIGAASALGGVTRMTVSIVVIMFELTGALPYVLPIMISIMIAKWTGDAFNPRGIYESWIQFNEYPYLPPMDSTNNAPLPDIPSSKIMTSISDLVVISSANHTIASLETLLEKHPHRGFPVIISPSNPILLGYISRTELNFALRTATSAPRSLSPFTPAYFMMPPMPSANGTEQLGTLDLRSFLDQTPITLSQNSPLHLTVSLFQKLGLRYVLFVDKGKLCGLLTKKDVWVVLNKGNDARGWGESALYLRGGALRDEGEGEERGLLGAEDEGTEEGTVDGLDDMQ
ncbi:MAG: hypothetical protein M1834_002444 [Cirrosporium novae-zelandiae]|nr:MAG: hypothetical protein M1834_002444 [Cirrosporium novae-zelandiae]